MSSGEDVAIGCLAIIVLVLAFTAFTSWLVMLALGVVAAETGWDVAIGYWACVAIVFLFNILMSGFRVKSS